MGCYFSINAAMLNNARHASVVAAIPFDKLLTETDGPFTKTGDQPAKPADVGLVVEALGQVQSLSVTIILGRIRENLRNLLS
jgi:TatD DNase family protein